MWDKQIKKLNKQKEEIKQKNQDLWDKVNDNHRLIYQIEVRIKSYEKMKQKEEV